MSKLPALQTNHMIVARYATNAATAVRPMGFHNRRTVLDPSVPTVTWWPMPSAVSAHVTHLRAIARGGEAGREAIRTLDDGAPKVTITADFHDDTSWLPEGPPLRSVGVDMTSRTR